MLELDMEDLTDEEVELFKSVHGAYFADNYTRNIHGWYIRKNLRVTFYYEPSWFSKKRMYWMHGWKWEPNPKLKVIVDEEESEARSL